jgi:decaprenyl-phosphate phosphoribosyltransferase
MGTTASDTPSSVPLPASRVGGASLVDYIRLARPMQWAKGAFVIVGPVYGLAIKDIPSALAVLGAFLAFGFASSACYVHNDVQDRERDRAHPRKRNRPIASGRISVTSAGLFGLALFMLAWAMLLFIPRSESGLGPRELLGLCVLLYIANVLAYSTWLKHKAVADVISLSIGFVLRVLGGCAAVAVVPSSWLLNVTFFVSMFLAFGKRLGERRTMGAEASAVRGVQLKYTDDLLRMAMVVTGVATLITYAQYVQSQSDLYTRGFNLLWITMLPATYCLLRAMVKVEMSEFDDPTDMATRDRPFQLAVACFGAITLGLILWFRVPHGT